MFCSSPVKLETLPVKYFVNSVTLLIVETFHQAVTAPLSESDFFSRITDYLWVSGFIFLKK